MEKKNVSNIYYRWFNIIISNFIRIKGYFIDMEEINHLDLLYMEILIN